MLHSVVIKKCCHQTDIRNDKSKKTSNQYRLSLIHIYDIFYFCYFHVIFFKDCKNVLIMQTFI